MKKESLAVKLITFIIVLFLLPVLYYFCGWLFGVMLKLLLGKAFINGMNNLFNTTHFTQEMIPNICGTLGVVGFFFKSNTSSSNIKI